MTTEKKSEGEPFHAGRTSMDLTERGLVSNNLLDLPGHLYDAVMGYFAEKPAEKPAEKKKGAEKYSVSADFMNRNKDKLIKFMVDYTMKPNEQIDNDIELYDKDTNKFIKMGKTENAVTSRKRLSQLKKTLETILADPSVDKKTKLEANDELAQMSLHFLKLKGPTNSNYRKGTGFTLKKRGEQIVKEKHEKDMEINEMSPKPEDSKIILNARNMTKVEDKEKKELEKATNTFGTSIGSAKAGAQTTAKPTEIKRPDQIKEAEKDYDVVVPPSKAPKPTQTSNKDEIIKQDQITSINTNVPTNPLTQPKSESVGDSIAPTREDKLGENPADPTISKGLVVKKMVDKYETTNLDNTPIEGIYLKAKEHARDKNIRQFMKYAENLLKREKEHNKLPMDETEKELIKKMFDYAKMETTTSRTLKPEQTKRLTEEEERKENQKIMQEYYAAENRPDKELGDRRTVGLAPDDAIAKEDIVLVKPESRAKSIHNFANFRWITSRQNSRLGDRSELKRMLDKEDEMRYGVTFSNKVRPTESKQKILYRTHPAIKELNPLNLKPISNYETMMKPAMSEHSLTTSTQPQRNVNMTQAGYNSKFRTTRGSPWLASYGMSRIQDKEEPRLFKDKDMIEGQTIEPIADPLIYPDYNINLKTRKAFVT